MLFILPFVIISFFDYSNLTGDGIFVLKESFVSYTSELNVSNVFQEDDLSMIKYAF